jgi:hypothetical protein
MTEEKVELSEPVIKVVVGPCPHCRKTTLVELSRSEFHSLVESSRLPREAVLPNRDAAFMRFLANGEHVPCPAVMEGEEDEASS